MKNHQKRATIVLVACVACSLLTGCGAGNSALNPKFQPQVSNKPDNFQFQTTGIQNVTQTLHYSWQNSGAAASINQACAITSGTALLTVRDSNGIEVYSGDLKANGTFTSVTGASGAWSIDVVLTKVNGTLNFRVQKL